MTLVARGIDNSEYYMNCAKINVTGNGSGLDGPDLFVANLASVNSFKTQLGSDVIFPNPGQSVEFGGDGTRAPPIGFVVVGSSAEASVAATPVGNANVISTSISLDVGGATTLASVTQAATVTATESKTKKKHHHHHHHHHKTNKPTTSAGVSSA